MRHPGADARGEGDQDRGQSGPPGQPGITVRSGPGGAAGTVQPGPPPRSAAPTNDQCRGRAVGLRAGGLGRSRARACRAHPHPGGEWQRRPHRGGHAAAVGDPGRAGRALGRRRRRSPPPPLRSVRLRAAAGRAPAGLRPRLGPPTTTSGARISSSRSARTSWRPGCRPSATRVPSPKPAGRTTDGRPAPFTSSRGSR